MTTYPNLYNKKDFIKFLKKININNKTIERFNKFPNFIIKNEDKFELNTILTYNSCEKTFYTFELNYYSKDLIEFLFNYKIFNDFDESINYLIIELVKHNYAKKEDLV